MTRRVGLIYLALLLAQTAGAVLLFVLTFPIFRAVMSEIGRPQEPGIRAIGTILLTAATMQGLYWWRFHKVPVRVPFRSTVASHIAFFAARASFFFGGAVFSLFFFRHLPELPEMPPPVQALAKGLAVFAVLFALFCYSLELERLARALEKPTAQ